MPRQINMHGSWSCKECTNSNYEKVEEAITQSEFVQPNWSGPWCWLNWKLQQMVALVSDVFHILGPEHWHNLNHTHSPISSHFDRVGFAGCNDFVGAGEDVVIMILSWDGNITIFVQEDVSVSSAQNRFSVCVYFTMKRGDTWSFSSNAQSLTNHGVFPHKPPSLRESGPHPHSESCNLCGMSLKVCLYT